MVGEPEPQKLPPSLAPRSKLREALLLSIGSIFLMVIFLIAGFLVLGVIALLLPFVAPPDWLGPVLSIGLAIVLFGAAFFVALPVALAYFRDPLGLEPEILIDATEPPLGGRLGFDATQAHPEPARLQTLSVLLECRIRVVRGRGSEDVEDRFIADRWETVESEAVGPDRPLRVAGSLSVPGAATIDARCQALRARAGPHRELWVDWNLVFQVQGKVRSRIPVEAAARRVGYWTFPLWR